LTARSRIAPARQRPVNTRSHARDQTGTGLPFPERKLTGMRRLLSQLIHQLGNGRAVDNARTERNELERVFVRIDQLIPVP
jgi:hypothetical protein